MAYSSEEKRYRLLLDKIAEELTHGEVDDLVFLLRFHIEGKRNRISINGDPRKLLTKLQKQNYIGVHNLTLLLEVFNLIGRVDLIQEIKRHDYITSENCQISPFIRYLWNFGQKLGSEDLEKSVFSLGWEKEKGEIKKPWQLFEKAFEKGNLEKDEYNKFKEFADTIGQTKTLESVMENGAKKSIQRYQNIHDSHKEKILDNEAHLSIKKPTQTVSGQTFIDTGSNMTLAQKPFFADETKLAMNLQKMQRDQHVLSRRDQIIYPEFGDVPDQSHSDDLLYHDTKFDVGRDHTQSQLRLISVPSPDDLSISQSVALPDPDIHTVKLALPSIPENHTQPNTNTSLIKAFEDFPREGERSDSQKELSEEIHLAGRISNQNLSRSYQNIHDPTNIETFQNLAANTEQMSSTDQSSNEAILTVNQPDSNDTGEFRRSSNMVDIARNSDKSRYDGDKRDGQDADVTGTNAQQGTQDLSAAENGTRKRGQAHCFEKKKEQTVSFIHNPRRGQIIKLDVSEMKEYCCWNDIIGSGTYGTVYKAKIDTKDNIGKYVIKEIKVAGFDFRMKSFEREIRHGRILHPHIIPIIAWAEDILENKGAVYLMYPCMENGSVRKKIEDENKGELFCKDYRTNAKIWLRCFYQVSQALDYLHKPGKNNSRGPVFHRDLTSSNILFDEDYNVKICDFGIAVEAKHHNTSNVTATPLQGSKGYHPKSMNPEKYRAYDDVYSFCVLVLEILTGEVVKNEELSKKYKMEDFLLQAIKTRAEKLKAAQWPNDSLRDRLAKQAWGVIESDAKGGKAEVTAADFFKDERLETGERYRQPNDPNRCVLCYINPTAKKFPLMGEECKNYRPPCAMYCVYCLSDHHNHLVCPLHGPSRPPFGDHVYGVFVAGNHVKHFQDKKNMTGQMSVADIADIFTSDANKVASILKFPLVMGIRNEHLEVVTPKEPGREGEMIYSIKEAFEKINVSIRNALTENKKKLDEEYKKNLDEEKKKNLDEDRLINSLFIFYFTGHGSKKDGLYLGSESETINASTQWLKKMLCETLRVDQVLVILDCCHAAEQNFARMKGESKIGIFQLSSCDKDKESICNKEDIKGSLFTHFLVQALQGDNFVQFGDCFTKFCKRCEKEKEKNPHKRFPCENFHLNCSGSQSVTLNSVKDYIREHYKLHEVELNLKEHCDDTDVIHLCYYKPEMSSISICLEDAQNGDKYHMVSHPESMPRLKLCIVRYIEEKKIQCKIQVILEFYRKHESQTSSVEKTSSLISIQPVAEREAKELIRLEDLYKIIPCGRAVEAKIRDNVEELKLGSNVILDSLKRSMTRSLEQDYEADGLKISKEYIHVEVNLIRNVIRTIIQLQGSDSAGFFSQEFKDLLKELQDILKKVLDNVEGTVLKIQLYDEFSVVEIT